MKAHYPSNKSNVNPILSDISTGLRMTRARNKKYANFKLKINVLFKMLSI
jgi:hypothetical protein